MVNETNTNNNTKVPPIGNILAMAKQAKASDVHITVGVEPKARINGKLVTMQNVSPLTPSITKKMASDILSESQADIFSEKGEIDTSISIPGCGRFRVNVFKQRGSVAMSFRIVDSEIPEPEKLGLPYSVTELYKKKRGLILVTGPTGSGKSTTLATIIDIINKNRQAHIITLEDPIEYIHNHNRSIVNQREIGMDSQSYAAALRAALREDPDVILVGEMRDFETISVAVTAAETGHLVLSTLHTIGAASTVDRIIDVFPTHQQQQIRVQLASVLEAVISQQLIPTKDNRGRVAAMEIMHSTPAIKNLIREGKTHQIISTMQTSKKNGMITMDDAIMTLLKNEKISQEQAITHAVDKESFANKLGLQTTK